MSFYNYWTSFWSLYGSNSLTAYLWRSAPRCGCLWWQKSSFLHCLGVRRSRSPFAQCF